MEILIVEGKNAEKAIEKAIERLGVTKDDIEYEVIKQEQKGFLGIIGGSPAIIKAWVKDKDNGKKDHSKDLKKYERKEFNKTDDFHHKSDNYDKEGNRIKLIISNLLDYMGFESNISFFKRKSVYFFKIDVVDKNYDGLLIGKNGETLGALQHIVNRIILPEEENVRKTQIVLDISGYRQRRDKELIAKANNLAKRVKKSGNKEMLEPLNSSDRRVVHQALSRDAEIYTYTVGEGQYKTLIIAPANHHN